MRMVRAEKVIAVMRPGLENAVSGARKNRTTTLIKTGSEMGKRTSYREPEVVLSWTGLTCTAVRPSAETRNSQ